MVGRKIYVRNLQKGFTETRLEDIDLCKTQPWKHFVYMDQGNPSQEWRVNYANSNFWLQSFGTQQQQQQQHFISPHNIQEIKMYNNSTEFLGKYKHLCVTVQLLPCFILNLRAISKYKPPGAYIRRVDLTEGFFRYEFRGPVYRLSRDIRYLVIHLRRFIFGGAYFRNFTVFNLCNQLRILQTFTEKDTNNLNNSSRIK